MRRKIFLASVLFALFIATPSRADNLVTLWGPELVSEEQCEPVDGECPAQTSFFQINTLGVSPPYTIHILNGDSSGNHRASAAQIIINGKKIFSPRNFNRLTEVLSAVVELSDPTEMTVVLGGGSNLDGDDGDSLSQLTISIQGYAPDNLKIVNSSGGRLEFPNSVVLDVPTGAVDDYTAITLSDLPAATAQAILDGKPYRSSEKVFLNGFGAEPNGLEFNFPVTATIPVSPSNGFPIHAQIDLDDQEYWLLPNNLDFDPSTGLAAFEISGFSGHMVVEVVGANVNFPDGCDSGRILVVSQSSDWSAGKGCQVIGDSVQVTFLDCPNSPVQEVNISETTPECGDDFYLLPIIDSSAPQVCRSNTFAATTIDQNNNQWDVPLTWETSDPSVIAIHPATGAATGMGDGSVLISARTPDPRYKEEALVTVLAAPPMSIEPASVQLEVNESLRLMAKDDQDQPYYCESRSADGLIVSNIPVSWSTANDSVVAIDQTGLVTGIAPGSATVTAMSGGQNQTAAVEVAGTQPPKACVETIGAFQWPEGAGGFPRLFEFSRANTLQPGWTRQQEVIVYDSVNPEANPIPDCISNQWVWRSLNESVATVTQSGFIIAHAVGHAQITVEHADHPEIWALSGVTVVDNWLDTDSNGEPDREVSVGSYSCSWAPSPEPCPTCSYVCPSVSTKERFAPYATCPDVTIVPGERYQCWISANKFTDPNPDCDVLGRKPESWYGPACVGAQIELRGQLKSYFDEISYEDATIIFRDETTMKRWW